MANTYWETEHNYSILSMDCGRCDSPFATVVIEVMHKLHEHYHARTGETRFTATVTCMRCGHTGEGEPNQSLFLANRDAVERYGYKYLAPFPDPEVVAPEAAHLLVRKEDSDAAEPVG